MSRGEVESRRLYTYGPEIPIPVMRRQSPFSKLVLDSVLSDHRCWVPPENNQSQSDRHVSDADEWIVSQPTSTMVLPMSLYQARQRVAGPFERSVSHAGSIS